MEALIKVDYENGVDYFGQIILTLNLGPQSSVDV